MTQRKHTLEENLIVRALAGRPLALPELAVAIGGMYPADLKPLLSGLEHEGSIFFANGLYHAAPRPAGPGRREFGAAALTLVPPHPANMDWRYEEGTARLLAERCLAASDGAGLFVGAPSALVHWRQLAPERPALLLDASKIMVSSINAQTTGSPHRAIEFDMCRPMDWRDGPRYDICLCDPPWYREHYLGAIGIASMALGLGAKMLVSLLPPLTRPAAIADRQWLLQQIEQLGFHLVSLEQNLLHYRTPIFESRSLATTGIDIPPAWRCGDLATFVKVREVDADVRAGMLAPLATLELVERDFSEILVRGHIWRLRGPFDDAGIAPELFSIEPNDVLRTVSRRYTTRNSIGLWLHDNRVFGIKGRAAFWGALTRMEEMAASLSSASQDATITEALRLLEPLLPTYDAKTSPERQIS